MLDADVSERAKQLVAALGRGETVPGESLGGGGSLPGVAIPTTLVLIEHEHPDRVAAALRCHEPPVVARVERGSLVVDLRTADPSDDAAVLAALRTALA
jgi:L-seryl-tRNA(Ser) seleniumtransferase